MLFSALRRDFKRIPQNDSEDYVSKQHQDQVKQHSQKGLILIIVKYLANDIIKKPRSFKIGIFCIFLVTGFIAAIQSAFQLSPVIFLSIAEDSVGDADIIMTPEQLSSDPSFSSIQFINQTAIKDICESTQGVIGCSPRWMLPSIIYDSNANNSLDSPKFRSFLLMIDPVQEKNVGLGRRFEEDLVNEGEAYLTASTGIGLGLSVGQNVTITMNIAEAILKLSNTNLSNETLSSAISESIEKLLKSVVPFFSNSDLENSSISIAQLKLLLSFMEQINKFENYPEIQLELMDSAQIYLNYYKIPLNVTQAMRPFYNNSQATANLERIQTTINQLPDNFTLSASSAAASLTPIIFNSLNYTDSLVIKSLVDNPKGKWPATIGSTLVVDSKSMFTRMWKSALHKIEDQLNNQTITSQNATLNLLSAYFQSSELDEQMDEFMTKIDFNQYAQSSNVIFEKKIEVYANKDMIPRNIAHLTDQLTTRVEQVNLVQNSVLLSSTVSSLHFFKLFFDSMLLICMFLLVLLAILLIYSLMISDVDQKTYEFGMLRALGLNKNNLIILIIGQAFSFSIPGLIVGFIMAYLLNSLISYFIFSNTVLVSTYQLHPSAIILSLCLGLCIPLVSVYLPIRRAISKTLRDSLDLYQRGMSEIWVSIKKLENLGLELSQTINAITLIGIGVMSFYFAPKAYVFEDISQFLTIVNIILILMIIGLTLLLNLIQPILQRFIMKFFLQFFRWKKHLEPVIVKNMKSHSKRNQKTALIYSISLSFLIFTSTGFSLQAKSIGNNMKNTIGSDIRITLSNDLTGLDEYGMTGYLQDYMRENPGNLLDFSFISIPLHNFPFFQKPRIESLSQYLPDNFLDLYGVQQNLLRSVNLEFYSPTSFDPNVQFPDVQDKGINGKNNIIDAAYGLFVTEDIQIRDNSVDKYGIASNSQMRDQNIQGGGIAMKYFDDQAILENRILPTTRKVERQKDEQQVSLIISSGVAEASFVQAGSVGILDIDAVIFLSKIRSTVKKMPGFSFSGFKKSDSRDALTGMKQFRYLVDSYYYYKGWTNSIEVTTFFEQVKANSTFNIPKQNLMIRFENDLTEIERGIFLNGLRNYFTSDFIQIFDVSSTIKNIEETTFIINIFAGIVTIIAMILSFFLILVSFIANMKETSTEFGILRAIGVSKSNMLFIYIIESISLIIASGIIGLAIGITIAITLTLQVLMFTELPFQFDFPYILFFLTFTSGILVSIIATYKALAQIWNVPVSSIVKGLF